MVWRVLVHGAAGALLAVGLVAQVVRPLAPDVGPLADLGQWFDGAYVARAEAYRGPLYLAAAAALALRVAVPCVVAFSSAGRRLVDSVVQRVGDHRPARAAAVVVLGIAVACDVVLLPLAFWAGYVHEGAFGFRTQGLGGWARDWLTTAALGWVAVGAMALGGWTLARRLPRLWPPVAAAGAAGLTAVLTLLAPLVVEPLFLTTRPLESGPVRVEVEGVLGRAGVPTDLILVADASRRTTKENAYVSGLWATRHVVLYDTLLAGRTPEEVGVVLAHELGHVRHADVARGVLLAGAGAVVGAYGLAGLVGWRVRRGRQAGPADPRAAAVVMAAVVLAGVLTIPVERAVSRRAEAAADLAALELTGDRRAFLDAQVGIARASLGDPAPPAWVSALWLTHPPPAARVAMGLEWPFDARGPAGEQARERAA